MLAENLLLGILGAAVGIVIAWWGTEACGRCRLMARSR